MKNKKGFTLIELIVVIALLGILSAIAVPRFNGFRKQANKAVIISNIKNLEDSCAMYNIIEGGWPTDGNYEGSKTLGFYGVNGEIELLEDGDYYQIDYDKIKPYIDKPEDSERYILRNPIGRVYYIREEGSGNDNSSNDGEDQDTETNASVGHIEIGNVSIEYDMDVLVTNEKFLEETKNSGKIFEKGRIFKEDDKYYIAGYNNWFAKSNGTKNISEYIEDVIEVTGSKVHTLDNNGKIVGPLDKGNICSYNGNYYIAPEAVKKDDTVYSTFFIKIILEQ